MYIPEITYLGVSLIEPLQVVETCPSPQMLGLLWGGWAPSCVLHQMTKVDIRMAFTEDHQLFDGIFYLKGYLVQIQFLK